MDRVMNVRLPEDLYLKVKAESERDQRTIHYIIRLAVKEYFDRREAHQTPEESGHE